MITISIVKVIRNGYPGLIVFKLSKILWSYLTTWSVLSIGITTLWNIYLLLNIQNPNIEYKIGIYSKSLIHPITKDMEY